MKPRNKPSRVAVGLAVAIVAIGGVLVGHSWLRAQSFVAGGEAGQAVPGGRAVEADDDTAPLVADGAAPIADGAPPVADGGIPDGPPPGSARETERPEAAAFVDGAMPDGVIVTDDRYPGITNLDPELLNAVRQAATDAAKAGITFYVNSGWRSAAYQNQLLRDAIDQYGSPEEAARWVATAETSAHVSGDAIDLGGPDADAWLFGNGAAYGLCQIYLNEPWHFELRSEAATNGCPAMYADPTQDPRMW